jgi:hypothetical protein
VSDVRAPIHPRTPAARRHLAIVAIAAALLVAACSGSVSSAPAASTAPVASTASGAPATSSAPTSAASVAPTATATPAPTVDKGPATASFSIVGTLGLAGQLNVKSVSCGYPTPTGPQIIVFGQVGTNGPFVQVFVLAGSALVRADTGSGTTFKMRTFTGSGITAFDGATGAQIQTTLTENTPSDVSGTGIGVISSISGKIDCANQQPGTATVVVTGTTPQGPMSGPLTSPKVTCTIVDSGTAAGTYVGVVGLIQIGSTTVSVILYSGVHQLSISESSTLGQAFFSDYKSTAVTLSANAAHISGDINYAGGGASPPPSPLFTLHVEGDATCGTTVHG